MSMKGHRFYARPPGGETIAGFNSIEGAELAAREFGEGAMIIDTAALGYEPMLQIVRDGELVYHGVSGWNVNVLDASQNMIEGIRNGQVAIVHAFIARGGDVNYRDENGGSPLHWAAARGLAEITRLLLDHGADPEVRDHDGESPLDIARARGHEEVAALLSSQISPKSS